VLILAVDSYITDMQRTLDSIVKYSERPLSIVVVGCGSGEGEVWERRMKEG
jgi:hypothetical protein